MAAATGSAGSAASGLGLPTFAAARALAKHGSCLRVGPHRRHVALAPHFLGRKRSGLREQLDRELLRYSESLGGVPVAYDHLKIVGELGDIYDDQGHVHLNVEADFVLFCPERGQLLVGTINKVAPSHVGCLVHGCFNASVPKPEHMAAEQWQSLHFRVGDPLEFEVARLDLDAAGVFCIRGKLRPASPPPACPALPEGDGTEPGAPGEKPKKKSKKGPKRSLPLDGDPSPASEPLDTSEAAEPGPLDQEAVNGLCEKQESETKRRQREQLEQEHDLLLHASDSSGYQSDHQKKKKKRKKPSEEAEGLATPEGPHQNKKKRKRPSEEPEGLDTPEEPRPKKKKKKE